MKPACMSDADYALWLKAELAYRSFGNRARRAREPGSPCQDCNAAFAAEMRRQGTCDGLYPGEPGYSEPGMRYWAYATEEERIAARRRTGRESSQRHRDQQRRALQATT